jgi:hypothetical protein
MLPLLVLFFLSPAIAELLSGSSPPVEFFSFFGLTFMSLLYGGGALLARELRVRWGKGWPTLVLLGMAYGIIEEGLMVKSFFDPGWVDVGLLGVYGRALGVNWVWAVELTAFHTVFSILIPIALVEMFFPARRARPWLDRKGFWILLVLFWLDVIFGFAAMTPYRPPLLPYLGAILLVAALVFLARRAPAPAQPPPAAPSFPMPPQIASLDTPTQPMPAPAQAPLASPRSAARWRSFYFAGLGATFGLFFCAWFLPNLPLPPLVPIAGILILAACLVWRLGRIATAGDWCDPQRLALLSGALTFLIVLAPLQELDKSRLDHPAGMALVGLAFALFLIAANLWFSRRRLGHDPLDRKSVV